IIGKVADHAEGERARGAGLCPGGLVRAHFWREGRAQDQQGGRNVHSHACALMSRRTGRRAPSLARGCDQPSARTKTSEFETAPNPPPCILIILMAARWLPWSVAPQQSSSNRHSKPRSLASRMVVCTQTSVVIPVRTRFTTPRVRSISS